MVFDVPLFWEVKIELSQCSLDLLPRSQAWLCCFEWELWRRPKSALSSEDPWLYEIECAHFCDRQIQAE